MPNTVGMVNHSADALLVLSRLLTMADVAKRLDVLPGTVVSWVRYGQLRAAKHAGAWWTTESDLRDFLATRPDLQDASDG